MKLLQGILGDEWMCFPVPEVSRRRTNELGNLMRVLVLRAIYFDDRARIAKQDLCGGLYQACLPRPGRAEKKKRAYRAIWRVQARAKNLIQLHPRFDPCFLPDDLGPQFVFKFDSLFAVQIGPKNRCPSFHGNLLDL